MDRSGQVATAGERRAALSAHAPLPDIEARDPMFRWLVHLGVPFIISLVVHTLLFTVLTLKTWAGLNQPAAPDVAEFEARIAPAEPDSKTGFQWPSAAPLAKIDTTAEWPESLSALRDLGDVKVPDARPGDGFDLGGFGVGEIGRSGILGTGSGAGEGGGAGLGAGFGTRPGVGQAQVWKVNASGNKFVYVVDYSGSIIVAVDDLKRELKRSIGDLSASQMFNVIIFYERRNKVMTEPFAPGLQSATPESKKAFFEWIEKKAPEGSTEPLPALRRALGMGADAIFFFSDGLFDDSVATEVAQAAKSKRTQIHAIVFDEILLQDMAGLPRTTEGSRRMTRIAEQSGGKSKIIMGRDLRTK